MSRLGRAFAAAAALASWACGSTEPGASPQVAGVVVSPSTGTLAVNAQLPLQAEVRDANGTLVPNAEITWTVQDPNVVSVSPAGVVTALAVGTSQVAANALGKSGISTITVTKTPVASVVVQPSTVQMTVGSKSQLVAAAYDAAQNALTGRTTIWTTSNSAVATVDNAGSVTAVGLGQATITATVDGVSGRAAVTVGSAAIKSVDVSPSSKTLTAGQSTTLQATVTDVNNKRVSNPIVTWSSSDAQVASVDAGGTVTASKVGTATITATSGGVSGTATITVSAGAPTRVTILPNPASVNVGATLQLTATAFDALGNAVPSQTFTWSSSNTTVATVSSSGLVTGKKAGSVTITATVSGTSIRGTLSVTVR